MMSLKAYIIANYLIDGAYSLHDLLASMIHVEHIPKDDVDAYLHEGLSELAERGCLRWTYEPQYGDIPSEKPDVYDVQHFEKDWQRCASRGLLREGVPDAENPTMLIEATDALAEEYEKPEYDNHERIVQKLRSGEETGSDPNATNFSGK